MPGSKQQPPRWRSSTTRCNPLPSVWTRKRQSADREARLELLRYQVRELEALGLKADEIPQLEEEHARLAHGAELIEGVQAVTQSLYDDEEQALARGLARAIGRLDTLAKHDPRLGEIQSLLSEAAIQIDEAASRLHQYLDGLDLDPQRLEQVERRMASVHELARKASRETGWPAGYRAQSAYRAGRHRKLRHQPRQA